MKTYLRYVDLRSDTFTKPSDAMRNAMRDAEVGDDCYGEDPTITELQNYSANYFGKEAALYFPTGTMTNVAAMRTLVNAGEEIILDSSYHINFFESAQMIEFAHAVLNTWQTKDGILSVEELKKAIDSKCRSSILYPKPKLVAIENSINSHGGKVFPLEVLKELYAYTSANNILLYMDGARLFNACVASGVDASEYAKYVDCLAVCLSKGLGAPTGSMLLGKKEVIERAQIHRKHLGGSLHQAGNIAAAGLYAIQNNIPRLKEDHENIQLLANALREMPGIKVVNAETNMVLFNVSELGLNAKAFVALAKERGLLLIPWQENIVRIVTHLNVSRDDVLRAQLLLSNLAKDIKAGNHVNKDSIEKHKLLMDSLHSKNISCEPVSTDPLAIRVKLAGQARKLSEFAAQEGLEVSVVSKDFIELIVSSDLKKEDLNDIALRLSKAHNACLNKEKLKTPSKHSSSSVATSVVSMFGSSQPSRIPVLRSKIGVPEELRKLSNR